MGKKYEHLSIEERTMIQLGLEQGCTLRAIARIYAMPRGELRSELIACLRQSRKTRRPRARGTDRRGIIPNMTSIHDRPVEVEERLVPGHWGGISHQRCP